MPKEGLSLATLVQNAEEVLGRKHFDDRKPKVLKYFAQPGVSVFRVVGKVQGEKEEYELNINFQNVSFSETQDKKHFLRVPTKLDGKSDQVYMEQLSFTQHPVKVWCSGTWFRFACEWYLHQHNSLFPRRKPRPYTKVAGSTRPSVNPKQLPCLCLSGDTKISLMSGEEIEIKNLEGKTNFYVYSFDLNRNEIVPGLVRGCKKTGEQVEVVAVTLDNGQVIKCTSNHKFLMKNGRYKEAKDLQAEESLQPLYKRIKEEGAKYHIGYEEILQPSGKWELTHRMVYEWKYGSKMKDLTMCHHKSFDKLNNDPTKLLAIQPQEHIKYHGKKIAIHNDIFHNPKNPLYDEEKHNKWKNNLHKTNIRKLKDGSHHMLGKNNPIHDPKVAKIVYCAAIKVWNRLLSEGKHNFQVNHPMKKEINKRKIGELTRKNMRKLVKQRKHIFQKERTAEDKIRNVKERILSFCSLLIKENIEINKVNYNMFSRKGHYPKWDYVPKYFTSIDEVIEKARSKYFSNKKVFDSKPVLVNHKVVSVKYCGKEDVYDLEVDGNHNFALSSGVFVHNCKHLLQLAKYLKNTAIMKK